MSDFSGFSKNLAYSIKTLNGFSKQSVKLIPDRWNAVANGDTIRVKLPVNSLIDLRTFSMFFDGTCTGVQQHFPRFSSSLIESLSIYFNGTLVETIQNYNVLFNAISDIQGSGSEQQSKRFLENIDPSVNYTAISSTGMITASKATGAVAADSAKPMLINQWLGMIGSASTPVIDTSDIGDVFVEIRFSSDKVLWSGYQATTYNNFAGYVLNNIRFTVSRISFNDPTYYELKASKLLSSGLNIAYQTYSCHKSPTVTKPSPVAFNFNVNANSLEQVIGTTIDAGANATASAPLLLYNAGSASAVAFNEVFAGTTLPIQAGAATAGDLFNNSIYFRRNAYGLATSQYEINNVQMNPWPLTPEEIFNETLISMGNLNTDLYSGVHPGCLSVFHFVKNYFCHILSLENLSGDGQYWRSGLDGRASSVNIRWNMTFTSGTDVITPIVFCRRTNVMTITEGHQITIS